MEINRLRLDAGRGGSSLSARPICAESINDFKGLGGVRVTGRTGVLLCVLKKRPRLLRPPVWYGINRPLASVKRDPHGVHTADSSSGHRIFRLSPRTYRLRGQSIRTAVHRPERPVPGGRTSRLRLAGTPARHALTEIENHSLAVHARADCHRADCHGIPSLARLARGATHPATRSIRAAPRAGPRAHASAAAPARPADSRTPANDRRRDCAATLSRARPPRRMGRASASHLQPALVPRCPFPGFRVIDPSRSRPRTGRRGHLVYKGWMG